MRLDPVVRDYPAFLNAMVEALAAPQTRVYLDTSVLMWLAQVGSGPREDFIAWCESRPRNSVWVPVWAAHELHKHLVGKTVAGNLRKSLERARKGFAELAVLAAERAEDDRCRVGGFGNRDGYVDAVRVSGTRLEELLSVVEDNAQGLAVAADRVVAFVNAHLLTSDVGAVLRDLAVTGRVRSEHRMPPGFKDAHKAGGQSRAERGSPKGRDDRADTPKGNQHGDVIIWEEILADVRAAVAGTGGVPQDVVLVSRDTKTDWVTAAAFVRRADGSESPGNSTTGLDVRLAHPMLVHELVTRAGGRNLFVVHPKRLAPVLDYAARRAASPPPGDVAGESTIRRWLAASNPPTPFPPRNAVADLQPAGRPSEEPSSSQPRTEAAARPRNAAPADGPARPAEGAAGAAAAAANAVGEEGSGAFPPQVAEVFADQTRAESTVFRNATQDEQLALLEQWVTEVREGRRSPYQFGALLAVFVRVGYGGFPEQAMAAVEALEGAANGRLPERAMLGLLATTYFERSGEARSRPSVKLGRLLLAYEDAPQYRGAFDAVGAYLRADPLVRLPYIPGARTPVACLFEYGPSVEGRPDLLSGVVVGGQAALVVDPDGDEARTLTALLGHRPSEGCSGQEVVALLASEFLIPLARLNVEDARDHLTWPDAAALVTLDTSSEGGLSAVAT